MRKLFLEFAEHTASIAQNHRVLDGIVGNRGNVVRHAPEIVAIDNVSLPVCGVVEMQTGLSGGFCTDVFCDLIDIIHEPHGVSEGIGIDILNQEGFFPAVRQTEVYLVGVVDIACLDGFVTKISIFNAEEPTYLLHNDTDNESVYYIRFFLELQ